MEPHFKALDDYFCLGDDTATVCYEGFNLRILCNGDIIFFKRGWRKKRDTCIRDGAGGHFEIMKLHIYVF